MNGHDPAKCYCRTKHLEKMGEDEIATYFRCKRCGSEPLRLSPHPGKPA